MTSREDLLELVAKWAYAYVHGIDEAEWTVESEECRNAYRADVAALFARLPSEPTPSAMVEWAKSIVAMWHRQPQCGQLLNSMVLSAAELEKLESILATEPAGSPEAGSGPSEAFLRRVSFGGGYIVCTAALTPLQIDLARVCGRLFVMPDGIGFVHMPAALASEPASTPEPMTGAAAVYMRLARMFRSGVNPDLCGGAMTVEQMACALAQWCEREAALAAEPAPDLSCPECGAVGFRNAGDWPDLYFCSRCVAVFNARLRIITARYRLLDGT
jgi:hypothetical protein